MIPEVRSLRRRQEDILEFIRMKGNAPVSEIFSELHKNIEKLSQITVNRDLKKLIDLNFLVSTGAGRSLTYKISQKYALLHRVDIGQYFEKDIDERPIRERFNFQIFSELESLFSSQEKAFLAELKRIHQLAVKKLSSEIVKKEFERLTIDLSWKSSKIEGNTYSLLETEELIREQKESQGHTKEEATMILNHKKTLDYIRSNAKDFKVLSIKKLEEIHSLLVEGLGVSRNVRKTLVGITGTRFRPLDNEYQIREALEKTCALVNRQNDPFEKACAAMLLIAYIQPFVDGNKRTSRLIGNAILLAHHCCPLSYRSIDTLEYKKAILLFYEQNNIFHFKKLFLGQCEFAVKNYFL